MSENITGWYQSTEGKTFLCVTLSFSQQIRHICTRLHSSVSTDAVTEFHTGYADLGSWPFYCVDLHRFHSWDCGFESRLFCSVLCISSGLWDELVTLSEKSCRVCAFVFVCVCESNCVCDLGTSTNSHSSPRFGSSTTESNINCTYRHSNSNWPLLTIPRHWCSFCRVDPFIRHISESHVCVESNHILTGISERRDSHEALRYASLLRPLL